ncbi:NAD(P)/FAD-dependent oxidoreductase, partial [bacterium]|nr:NAD(P)/FAD-dependent oxidoreductase [bacterium]MBU1024876.1 NAD(P)/FAD-dependent oxidoreductase [bacterium]
MGECRVIVVGGGASGLMAAGTASMNGADVVVLEKMKRCARKLRITGKGRCNITNVADIQTHIDHFGKNGRFLFKAYSRFFTTELLELLNEIGIKTVTERGGRVFPVSEKAQDVVDALVQWCRKNGVEIHGNSPVDSL